MIDLEKIKKILEAKHWSASYIVGWKDTPSVKDTLFARRKLDHSGKNTTHGFAINEIDDYPRLSSGGFDAATNHGHLLSDEIMRDIIFIRDVVALCKKEE